MLLYQVGVKEGYFKTNVVTDAAHGAEGGGMKYHELTGVTIVPVKETMTYEVARLHVTVAGRKLEIEALKSKEWAFSDYLPAKVYVKGSREAVWSFRSLEIIGFNGQARLFRLRALSKDEKDIDLIGLVDRRDKLLAVIPLSEIQDIRITRTADFGYVCLGGQYQLQELISLKVRLAKQEKLDWSMTDQERRLLDTYRKEMEALEEAERAKREAARRERRQEILSRPEIISWTKNGDEAKGVPVTGEEWQVLPDNVRGILVESYDQENRAAGKALTAFRMEKKQGGRPKRIGEKEVGFPSPKDEADAMAPSDFQVFLVNGTPVAVPVVTKEAIETMKKKLNSGTMVAVMDGTGYKIYSLQKGEARQLDGEFEPR